MKEKEIFKTAIAEVYVEDGILHLFMKKTTASIEEYRAHFMAIKAYYGPIFPIPALTHNDKNTQTPSKEARAYIGSAEVAEIISAVAIINTSNIMRLTANLFLKLTPSAYPIKLFSTEEEAAVWLRSYLK